MLRSGYFFNIYTLQIHPQSVFFSPLCYSPISLENATAGQGWRFRRGAAAGGKRKRKNHGRKPNWIQPPLPSRFAPSEPIKLPKCCCCQLPTPQPPWAAGGWNEPLRANLNIFPFPVQRPAPGVGSAESCPFASPVGLRWGGRDPLPVCRWDPSGWRNPRRWLKQHLGWKWSRNAPLAPKSWWRAATGASTRLLGWPRAWFTIALLS